MKSIRIRAVALLALTLQRMEKGAHLLSRGHSLVSKFVVVSLQGGDV
jgi:hypothetical protein